MCCSVVSFNFSISNRVSFKKDSVMADKTEIDTLASTNETDEYRFGYTPEEIERLRWEARSKDPEAIFFASPMMVIIGNRL